MIGGANAQQFGSFWHMTSIHGITVTRTGLQYNVALSSTASDNYVTFTNALNQTQTELFTQVMGFYKLSDGVQLLTASGANTTTNGANWGWYPDHDTVAGWDSNPANKRIDAGEHATFTYSSLVGGVGGPPSWVTDGFHLQFSRSLTFGTGNGATTGSTFFVSTNGHVTPPGAVPEPFTMSLGLAGAGLFIRRRIRAKAA